MASTRLPYALSTLCRSSIDVYNPALRSARAAQRIRAYHSTTWRPQQETVQQRYGTANEPPPPVGQSKANEQSKQQAQGKTVLPMAGGVVQQDTLKEVKVDNQKLPNEPEPKREPATTDTRVANTKMTDPMLDSADLKPPGEARADTSQMSHDRPLESVLNSVPEPTQQDQVTQEEEGEDDDDTHAEDHADKTFDEHSPPIKAPHMEPPRYIHHFDTYGLVQRLKDGHWDEKRAITVMKAVRLMLADNTTLAKDALVSKSHLENEAYLFKAACAELKTEVTTRRKSEQEKMRTERTQLQHEVDILSQRLGQESASLKDDLKGMFDDRKMAVRNEQRDMESKIQRLNYRITVELQADGKSDVEGLRWIMTRRVIMTLGLVVLMVVSSLKLASNAVYAEESTAKKSGGGSKPSASTSSAGTQTEFSSEPMQHGRHHPSAAGSGEMLVIQGENPAYVSLG